MTGTNTVVLDLSYKPRTPRPLTYSRLTVAIERDQLVRMSMPEVRAALNGAQCCPNCASWVCVCIDLGVSK